MLNDKNAILHLSRQGDQGNWLASGKSRSRPTRPARPGGTANDFLLRVKAIGSLGDIGTAESIPLLQSMSKRIRIQPSPVALPAVAAIQRGRSELTPFAQDQPAIDPQTRRGLPSSPTEKTSLTANPASSSIRTISSRVKSCSVRGGIRLRHGDVAASSRPRT